MFFTSKNKLKKIVDGKVKKLHATSVVETEKSSKAIIEDLEFYNGKYREREITVTYEDMWKMYLRNDWVRACVDKITKSVTNANLYATAINENDTSSETKKKIEQIQQLLDDPNMGLDSWKDVRREYLRDILIYDAGALEIVYDSEGIPVELYSLPGERVRLIIDKHGNFIDEEKAYLELGGYFGGKKVDSVSFARSEVVYFVANPKSGSVYGLSPLESLYLTVVNDISASKYNADFFENNAEAAGIYGFPGMKLSDLKRLRRYLTGKTKGKPHRSLAVNSEVQYTRTSLSNRDMQFLEYQKWLLCKIMSVYDMQPIVMGIVDSTTGKLNSREQREAYKEEAIKPLLELECYQLTKMLVQQAFGYDNIKITYESIDIRDEVESVKNAVEVVTAGLLTVDEARKKYLNMEPIEIIEEQEPKIEPPKKEEKEDHYAPRAKYIVQRGNQWCVISHRTGRSMGCYDTKEEAEERLRQIQQFRTGTSRRKEE